MTDLAEGPSKASAELEPPALPSTTNFSFHISRHVAKNIVRILKKSYRTHSSFLHCQDEINCALQDLYDHTLVQFTIKYILVGHECKRKNIEKRPCVVFNLLDGHGTFDCSSDSLSDPCTGLVSNSGDLFVSSSSGKYGTIILTGSKLRKTKNLDTRCNQVRSSPRPTATAAALCAQAVSLSAFAAPALADVLSAPISELDSMKKKNKIKGDPQPKPSAKDPGKAKAEAKGKASAEPKAESASAASAAVVIPDVSPKKRGARAASAASGASSTSEPAGGSPVKAASAAGSAKSPGKKAKTSSKITVEMPPPPIPTVPPRRQGVSPTPIASAPSVSHSTIGGAASSVGVALSDVDSGED